MTEHRSAHFEVRKFEGRATVEGPAARPVIRGHAIVFNEPSLVLASFMGGGFQEIIRPEAVERTMKLPIGTGPGTRDLRAFFDHDPGRVLGRETARTLRATVDRRGLLVEIDPDPEIGDHSGLLRSIKRGDITGMSFSFRTEADGDRWNNRTTPPTREVTDMSIFEVSVVAMPAYEQTDVAVALRSRALALGQVRTVDQLHAAAAAKAAAWRR